MNGASQPSGVLALVIFNNFAAVVVRSKLVHFSPETDTNIVEEGIATSKYDVFEEITSERLITLHYRVVDVLLNAFRVDVSSLGHSRIE